MLTFRTPDIMALVVVCGGGPDHTAYGFRYWHNPGPLVQYLGIDGSLGRFLGFWTVFSNAVYAYSGVENISVAAAEVHCPRRAIPIAAKRIFWRGEFDPRPCHETVSLCSNSRNLLRAFHLHGRPARAIERSRSPQIDWNGGPVTIRYRGYSSGHQGCTIDYQRRSSDQCVVCR